MQRWFFCIVISVFSVTWIFRNHSNMLILLLKKHFNLTSFHCKECYSEAWVTAQEMLALVNTTIHGKPIINGQERRNKILYASALLHIFSLCRMEWWWVMFHVSLISCFWYSIHFSFSLANMPIAHPPISTAARGPRPIRKVQWNI